MVKYNENSLDKVFAALADPTRRQVIANLSQGSSPVSELASPHQMSLPGFMKHLQVLEDAGLITRNKAGRVVQCHIEAQAMQQANEWLRKYEIFWTKQLDALGQFLEYEEETK